MKKIILALGLLAVSTFACAQSSLGANAGATSGATAEGGQLVYSPTSNSDVRYPASTAIAPALSATAPCMGSSTAGFEALKFGFSLGSNWSDEDCKVIRDSSHLWNVGLQKAAIVRLCESDNLRYSISMSGGIAIPGPTKGSFYMVGCPMTKTEWIAAGRPTIDLVTGQPTKLGVLVTPSPEPMPAPVQQVSISADDVKRVEWHAIQIEAKQKYGIDLAVQEGTKQQVAIK